MEFFMFPINWFTCAIKSQRFQLAAVGQIEVEHVAGNILWVLDLSNSENRGMENLLDFLALEAGLRKLHYLKVSLDKCDLIYDHFIRAGYFAYGCQTFWKIKKITGKFPQENIFTWRRTRTSDLFSINLLQNRLLSEHEKRTTPSTNHKIPAYVLFHDEVLIGYAYVQTTFKKALFTPVLDPQIVSIASSVISLINHFLNRVPAHYLILSASQQWVSQALNNQVETIRAERDILIKPLAISDKYYFENYNHALSSHHPDIATPISHSYKKE